MHDHDDQDGVPSPTLGRHDIKFSRLPDSDIIYPEFS
jgi:hypothetical protein